MSDKPADRWAAERLRMVERQVADRGVRDPRVLKAMRVVPRERFLPPAMAGYAYEDRALCIDMGQTISQPYIVGLMSAGLAVEPRHRVLEVGTGSGYQTAILARLGRWVYTIERLQALSVSAQERLASLGVGNVSFRVGDGSLGWPEEAPFDRIIVTAAAPMIVQPLVQQLVDGGRMVLPVGEEDTQQLLWVQRCGDKTTQEPSIAVRFVKLIGAAGFTP